MAKCIRCDRTATSTVQTNGGGFMDLCDYCADQWDEDYADEGEKSQLTASVDSGADTDEES